MQQEAPNVLDLTPGNSFYIDDFLNFSNEEIAGPIGENHQTDYWVNDGSANFDFLVYGNSFSNTDYHCHASDFFVPFDELAEQVEWVSNFVENSKSTPLASQRLGDGGRAKLEDSISSSGGCSLNAVGISSISCVPTRPRSKRSRAARDSSSWYSPQSWTTSYSSSSKSSSYSNLVEKAEIRRLRRRCRHCGTEKTPQWRAGPKGPKSLCNACGVRFKSGRLLPEYRPAASPTFEPSLHSNSHRNVLYLRLLKKDL